MCRWLFLVLVFSATCAIALPVNETAQQQNAPPAQQSPRGITLPPSVLSTQPVGHAEDSLDESQRMLSRATAAAETDDWVLWIGALVAALAAIQLAFDTLDFSFFGIDSRGRRRRLLQEEEG
jgi:hypothetical protein